MAVALDDIASMRLFSGLLLDGARPDHTTIMSFRHRQTPEEVSSDQKKSSEYQQVHKGQHPCQGLSSIQGHQVPIWRYQGG